MPLGRFRFWLQSPVGLNRPDAVAVIAAADWHLEEVGADLERS